MRNSRNRFVIIWLYCFFISVQCVVAQTIITELNSHWRFRKTGDKEWLPAGVPGTVHMDLLANKKIPDPFFGTNEKDLQWIDTCSWEYELWFDADSLYINGYQCELQFEGLDTYAKVYLNDSQILVAENMFRTWKVECNNYLRHGKNHLVVIFEPAVKRGKNEAAKNSVTLPGEEKVYTRKAQYQYGWDWGPRFTGCGIWRPVKFVAWKSMRIQDVHVTHVLRDSVAEIKAALDITADKLSIIYIKVVVEGMQRDSFYFEHLLTSVQDLVAVDFKIKNPMRWNHHGSGKQNLYRFTFQVMNPQHDADIYPVSYGIRDVKLVQEADDAGKSFYFNINDTPVFMKGANWIPADHFLPRVNKNKYRELLMAARDANMNMIRVWGGGVYEDDAFYDLCDSLGIMVWQDFMFACAMYPGDSAFMTNVQQEVMDNVSRLRNHPCIVLWCGNNEVDEGWKNWGWQKQFSYSAADSAMIWKNYLGLFHKMIPGLLVKMDPSRPYWESSPSIGWGREESLRSGDSHYWGVWWGMQPFEMYAVKTGRFMSEYGFQGMPSMQTIESFAAPGERNLRSAAIKNHQKHPTGFETIDHYMADWYKKPNDFESYMYVSQLLQSEGMKTAIEAHRRAKPYCMGSLYWQFNDCWPVVSWSSIDYSGNRKAVHYAVKKCFEKFLVSAVDTGENFSVYVVADDITNQKATLHIEAIDFSGKILWTDSAAVVVSGSTAVKAFSSGMNKIRTTCDPSRTVIRLKLIKEQHVLAQNLYYFKKPKDLSLEKASVKIVIDEIKASTGTLVLSTDILAKNVFLDTGSHAADFSENYFDLLPGETKTITFRTSLIESEFKKQLVVRTVSDTY